MSLTFSGIPEPAVTASAPVPAPRQRSRVSSGSDSCASSPQNHNPGTKATTSIFFSVYFKTKCCGLLVNGHCLCFSTGYRDTRSDLAPTIDKNMIHLDMKFTSREGMGSKISKIMQTEFVNVTFPKWDSDQTIPSTTQSNLPSSRSSRLLRAPTSPLQPPLPAAPATNTSSRAPTAAAAQV